jgi:transposase
MVGCHISDELKAMALSMSLQGIPDSEIHELTGISTRSLKRLRSTHCRTGEVSHKPLIPGQPHNLMSMQVNFLCDCVKRQPDMTLMELQTELRDVCGVEMSVTMVTRSLHREGFTMKTVRPFLFLLSQLAHQLC